MGYNKQIADTIKEAGQIVKGLRRSSKDEFKIVKRNKKAYVFFPDKYFGKLPHGRKMYDLRETFLKGLSVEKVSEGVYSIGGGFVRKGQTLSAVFEFTDQIMTISTADGGGERRGRKRVKYIINVTFEDENNEDNPTEEPVKTGGYTLKGTGVNYTNENVKAIYKLDKPINPKLKDTEVVFNGISYEFKTPRYILYDKSRNKVYDSFSRRAFPQAFTDHKTKLGEKTVSISKDKIKNNNAHYIKIKQYDLETGFMRIDQNKLNNSVSWFGSQGINNVVKEKNIDQKLEKASKRKSIISRIANKVRSLFK